jgi:hypothetical protein
MNTVEAENATAGNGDTTAEIADFHSISEFWRNKKMVLITPSKTKNRSRKKTTTSSRAERGARDQHDDKWWSVSDSAGGEDGDSGLHGVDSGGGTRDVRRRSRCRRHR